MEEQKCFRKTYIFGLKNYFKNGLKEQGLPFMSVVANRLNRLCNCFVFYLSKLLRHAMLERKVHITLS
jgi:hypothetical protein